MKNLVKKILILFVIVFIFCMMTITFAATMHEFDLNEIPSKMTVHLGDEEKSVFSISPFVLCEEIRTCEVI